MWQWLQWRVLLYEDQMWDKNLIYSVDCAFRELAEKECSNRLFKLFFHQNPVWCCWHNQSVSEVFNCFEFFEFLVAVRTSFLVENTFRILPKVGNRLYLVVAQLALLFAGLKYAYTKKMGAFCWEYLLSIFPARTKITKSWQCESSVCLFNLFFFLEQTSQMYIKIS